jgi:hypothetical protein
MLRSLLKVFGVSGWLIVGLGNAIANPAIAGQDGPSKTIFLDSSQSSPMSLDLSGSNGRDGADGRRVGNRYFGNAYDDDDRHHRHDSRCTDSDVGKAARNITLSSGSTGEAGERGEDGGDGGNLTIYYDQKSSLKNIFVNASGGYGGRGGRGGRGTRGCRCPLSSWKVDDKTYHCTDGSHGSRGSDGANGANGRIGQLRLIAGKTPIAGDRPTIQMNLSSLAKSQPIALSLNRWDSRHGATSLLQSGSRIADEYQEYRDRLEKTATVQWRSKSSMGDYGSQLASLRLNEQGKIGFEFADQQIWSVTEQVNHPQGTTVAIDAIVHQEDALRLTPGITDKQNRDFTLAVIDTGAKSDVVATSFWVKVKSNSSNGRPYGFGNSETHFEGVVPANLVKQDYNRFLLNLGALPVAAEVFQAGKDVEVEIRISRSLGSRSATKTLDWSGTVY